MAAVFKRSVQLGLLAGQVAQLRWRGESARQRLRERIVERLGLLHGLPQKIGQLLAFSEVEAGDPVYTRLTENLPALSAEEAFAEMDRQFARLPAGDFRIARFRAIDPCGISASIGQVHRALLADGREVAVKIQYPDIAEALRTDLQALGWLSAPVGDLRRGFDVTAYRTEIGTMLAAELDYEREAEWMRRFRALTEDLGLAVPAVVDEMTGARILVSTWLPGEHLSAARQWPHGQRVVLGRTLLELFLRGVLDWGFFHADPHPGNYRFLWNYGEPLVGLLDFGCVKEFEPRFSAGLAGLIDGSRREIPCTAELVDRFVAMGFSGERLAPLANRLPDVVRILVEPWRQPGPFEVRHWRMAERMAEALGDQRLDFRLAGPPSLIYFLRAFQGLLHYLKALDVAIDWSEALPPAHATRVEEAAVAVRSNLRDGTVRGTHAATTHRRVSEALCIRVAERGLPKVSLTFRSAAADDLPDLVPADLLPRLSERGIDLAALAAQVRRNGYRPGEIFTLHEGDRTVRVWLE